MALLILKRNLVAFSSKFRK